MGENVGQRHTASLLAVQRWCPCRANSWQYNGMLLVFYGIVVFEIITVFLWEYGIDSGVYRLGGAMVSGAEGRHSPLYGEWEYRTGDPKLPFTYPPFAALLFIPLAFAPPQWVSLGFMFVTTAIAVLIANLMVRILGDNSMVPQGVRNFLEPRNDAKSRQYRDTLVLCFAAMIVIFNNAWLGTINFSQINAILMLAVLWDTVLKHRCSSVRGILLGVVSGIKLTPLAFGLFFLVQRDWKSIVRMGAGFAGSIVCAWLILPRESQQFWTEIILDSSRPGDHAFIANLSLRGMLEHVGIASAVVVPLWLVLSACTIVVAAVAMVRLLKREMPWTAVGVNAIVMLLISPISWGHHWIWSVIFLVCFAVTIQQSYREKIFSRRALIIQWCITGAAAVFFSINSLPIGYMFELTGARTTGSSPALASTSFGVFFALYIVCYWAVARLPRKARA